MKRFCLLICLGLLAGCEVVLFGGPTPVAPNLNVLEATYSTNYQDAGTGISYICDNRPTTLTYRFRYEGELERWASYLEGQTLGRRDAERTFDPGTQGVSRYQDVGFEVSYQMSAYFAPYKQDKETVLPQAIEVVPVPQPVLIGATKLYLILEGASGKAQPYGSGDIPVVANCP